MAETAIRPLSLAELGPRPILCKLKFDYGREIDVPLMALTREKWNEIGFEVINPVVPRTVLGKGGEKQANIYDVEYVRDINLAEEERMLRRLVWALKAAGNDIGGPTASLKEGAALLRQEVDTGILDGLTRFLRDVSQGGKWDKDSFRHSDSGAADDTNHSAAAG
jgi:hypothetical protein